MIRLFATTPLSHVNGTNPCMDSAYTPEFPAVVVRQLAGRGSVARFGNGDSGIVGQSYEPGAHPSG